MSPNSARGRRPTMITDHDVERALARISEHDPSLATEARQVYDTLTWGEGPQALRLAGVRDWLWYRIATKYLTDEPGYMQRLADTAAALFDELGLIAYAALCSDEATVQVHRAWQQSDTDGYRAMKKAFDASVLSPADLDDFVWGDVMGFEESGAYATAENALEDAFLDGDVTAGNRGWRNRVRSITATVLDGDRPDLPGQSWRTMVMTERVDAWVQAGMRRSEPVGRRRSRLANRLLVPIAPPDDLEVHLRPLLRLLELFGNEQTLTQAGYLNRPFVRAVAAEGLWQNELLPVDDPRSEIDLFEFHELRRWLQATGVLRKSGRSLLRTKLGTALAENPLRAWKHLTEKPGSNSWTTFIIVDLATVLLAHRDGIADDTLIESVEVDAFDLGWRTGSSGGSEAPSRYDVIAARQPAWKMLEVFGFLGRSHDRRDRRYQLTPAGEATLLAMVRHVATGPQNRGG